MLHLVSKAARQLLQVDAVRFAVAGARYAALASLPGRMRTYDPESAQGVAPNALSHNLRLKRWRALAGVRTHQLIRPLSVLDVIAPRIRELDVLSIGPRGEAEILNLIGHGFSPSRIRALDLMSYSSWIELGDMHEMPYQDDSFDALLAGWVIAYSDRKRDAASEMIRVSRDGAVLALSAASDPRTNEEVVAEEGYLPGSTERIRRADDILQLFEGAVDHVYLTQEPKPGTRGTVLTLFSIRKPETSSVGR